MKSSSSSRSRHRFPVHAHLRGRRRKGRLSAIFGAFALIASLLSFSALAASPAAAAGGSYTLNFAAADPSIYLPPIPFPGAVTAPVGRGDGDAPIPLAEFNDGTSDVRVESLAPQDMALGQIVPFETKISVSGITTPENGVITFVNGWNTLTTNSGDFGYDARNDDVGYGVIAAFIDTGDGAHVDANDDAAVTGFTWSLINDEIVGIFTVSGLDDGDVVVLEAWLVLDDTIPAGIGGNVQSRLIDAATGSDQSITIANSGAITLDNGDSISTGNQTVPLLQPSAFFTADVDLSVAKSDDPDPVALNGTLTYTVSVTNAGPAVANSVVLYDELDPNTTFVSASGGGFINTDTGDAIPDGAVQWDVGALAPGESAQFTVTVTVNADAPTSSPDADLTNTVTATTISDDVDPSNNVATEPTDVLAEPELTLDKTTTTADYSSAGDVIDYAYLVTNSGNVPLAGPVTVTDDRATVTCPPVDTVGNNDSNLDPTEAIICSASYIVTQGDLDAGSVTNTATASADGTDSNQDDETVTANQAPALTLDKTALPTTYGTVGETISYSYLVTNSGNVLLAGPVTVVDDKTTVTCPGGGLAPGEAITCDASYTITQADINAGSVTNLATASADGTDSNPDTETVTAVQTPAMTLVKTASPATYSAVDDEISYSYDVTNTGNVPLAGPVTVTDNKATVICPGVDTVGNNDADLNPGESITCTAIYTITQADLNAGSVTNIATATADGTDSNPDDETVTADQTPALTLDKTASPGTYDTVDQEISYSYLVTNTGNVSLAGPVTVADDNTTVSCPTVDTVGNGDLELDPGESITCTATYTITQADITNGSVTNVATASADGTDSNPDTETVTAVQNPALTLVKTASPTAYAAIGETISYDYLVTNSGNVPLAGPVTVADDKATVTCPGVDTVGNNDSNLDPSEAVTCSASYSIDQADLDAGSVTNVATASADGTDSDPDDETVTANQTPALSIDKSLTGNADEDGSGDVSLGDTLTYTLTATNGGNVTLNSVMVSDGLTTDSTSCASVAPGGTCVLVVTYVVTAGDVAVGSIANTGVADSDETDPVEDTEDVPVPNPVLAVDKEFISNDDEDESGHVSVGDTLNYTITATNTGAANLTNVVVSDDLTGASTSCALLEPVQTCVLATSYIVTQADVDTGEVDNIGTAESTQTDPVTDPETVPITATVSIVADKGLTGNVDVDNSGGITDGDELTYTITATNDGEVTLTNVTIDDDLTGTTDAPCAASLAPTQSCSVDVTYTVTQADVDAGVINNLGTVEGTDPDGDPVSDTDPETVPIAAEPSIDALKELTDNADGDGSGTVSLGDELTYTITATNDGTANLTNVVVSDNLAGFVPTGGTTPCALVVPGGTCTLVGTYLVTDADVAAGSIDNIGTVEGTPPTGPPVTDTDPETVPVPQNPALSVDKVLSNTVDADGSFDVSVGDTLQYSITATNDGNVTLTNVTVSDDLTGTATSCATVAPLDTCVLTTSYTVTEADVTAGQVVNTGTADSTETDPVDDIETVPVPQPALAVEKVFTGFDDNDSDNEVSLDDRLFYTITATNTGSANLTNVTVVDSLTGDLAFCALVAPGLTCPLDVSYVVTQADVDAGQVVNTAVADSDQTQPEDEDETVPVAQNPSIEANKVLSNNADEDGSTTVSRGDTLTFTITAINDGDVTLTNVTVDDDLTGTIDAFCSASLAPGADCSVDVTYVVTQADVDAGKVENTGTVEGTPPVGDPVTDADPEEVPVPQNPSILADKDLFSNDDDDGDNQVSAGDTLTYRITATNDGDVTLTDVTVSDVLTGTIGASCAASLAPGDDCFVDVTYLVTQDDVDAGVITNVGEVEGTPPFGPPVEDTDPETVPVPQNPVLTISKLFSRIDSTDGVQFTTEVDADGDVIVYEIIVANAGDVTLTNIVVSDPLLADLSCPTATLLVNQSMSCFGSYTVTQADLDDNGDGDGDIDNTASADSDQTAPVSDSAEVPVDQAPAIEATKVLDSNADDDSSGNVSLGDTLTYVITASNTGNVTLTNVTVDDDLTGATDVPCAATLPVGLSCQVTVDYIVTQTDVDAGEIENVGTVEGLDPDGEPVEDDDPEAVDVPQFPAIEIVKDFADDAVTAGGAGSSFTLVVTNTGNVTLSGALIEDAVDSRLTVTGVSGTAGADSDTDSNAQTVEWLITSLAVGQSATITVDFVVDASVEAATVDNVVAVAADGPLGDPGDPGDDVTDTSEDAVDIVTSADLSISKDDGVTEVTAGDGVTHTYMISVANDGPSDADNVVVSDSWPAEFAQGTVTSSQGTCLGGPNFTCDLGGLAAGGSATITVEYTVPGSTQAGSYTNTVTVSSNDPDPDPSDNSDDDTNEVVTSSDLSITKDDGETVVTAGDGVTYTYTITVDNDGPSDADGVTVVDSWPAEFAQGTVTSSQGTCSAGPDFTCDLGGLAAGGSATITVEYTVPSSTQAGSYTNSVTVSSDEPDPDPSNNSDDDTNEVETSSDLSITKDDGVTEVTAGDGVTYTYTITVNNAGPSDADGVTVTEDGFPAGFDMGAVASSQGSCAAFPCDLGTIVAGESATITVDYTVPSETSAGFETNTVSVTSDEPDPDPSNNSDDDTNEVLTDINLSIVKTFDPTSVPQGTAQSFTIVVSNAGPSDAVDVSVTDTVNGSLEVTGVSLVGAGDCGASSGQEIDCAVQIPAGQSVTVTVNYVTAPFLGDDGSTTGGDTFRFVFVGGDILEGSTASGQVSLNGEDVSGNVTIVESLTRNDVIFDPDGPGGEPAIELHLSCSDPFTGGWGQSGGPIQGVNSTDYQVAFFTIARYNNNGFLKSCGNVTVPFGVPNTATATGDDSSGTETVSDDASVTVEPGITLDRLQTNGKRLTVRLTNFTGENKDIADISIEWPDSNGNLTKIRLDNPTVWQGSVAPPEMELDAGDSGWNGGTLLTGEGILRFDFRNKSANSGYTIRVNFTDGTFLDITA